MIRFAFKYATEAAARETGLARIFSEGIARVTGGQFSHVEIWYDGPQNAAKCFAAREPDGTGFATLDLTDAKLWEIELIIDPVMERYGVTLDIASFAVSLGDRAWFQGRTGRRYNFMGIAGIGGETAIDALENVIKFKSSAGFTDPHDDFCSQVAFEFLQDRRGKWAGFTRTEMIAPSGFGKGDGRYGLYELVKGTQSIQTTGATHA